VDVYKPYGEDIKGYDVNALYPSQMLKQDMPVGTPKYFEGDIYQFETDPFGFFEVEVDAPLDLNIPILQTRIKTKNGYRTIAPVGTWVGTYFSEEIKEAKILGYKFKTLRGYQFERANIFEKYISELSILKENSKIGSANYLIYKYLMNSLYGRFGMNPRMETTLIIDSSTSDKYLNNDKLMVTNNIDLKNGKELISYFEEIENSNKINISIPLASAVTSYSRIFMSRFKIMLGENLFYSDTDSCYTNKTLDAKYIDERKIGKFKIERLFNKGIFLSPKMYGGKILSFSKNQLCNEGLLFNKFDEYVKVKGVKLSIKFSKLLPLLFKNKHIELKQEKWFRDPDNSTIQKKESKHILQLTSNKREIIYENNKFVNTKPLILNKYNYEEDKIKE